MEPRKTTSLSREGKHIAVIAIDNPPANVLSIALLDELDAALDKVFADKPVKSVIMRSLSPKFFVAGADIKEIAALDSNKAGREFAEKGQALLNKIERASTVVMAAVEGICMGGGCELAMACHLRIAGSQAVFGLPEINLGIMPGFGGTQRLPRLVGESRALEWILTGKKIEANDAFATGLVNHVVEQGAAYETALVLARQIETKGALAIAAILTAMRDRESLSLDDRLKREARLFGELFETGDKREGVNAFLGKRPPRFEDR